MSTFDTVNTNFKTFLESTIGGWKENTDAIDLTKKGNVPTSIWDHGYSLIFGGHPKPIEFISVAIDILTTVRLQLAFELNQNDDKASYLAAVGELENILQQRLLASTWRNTGNVIQDIRHLSTTALTEVTTTRGETFMVAEAQFECQTRIFQ